MPVCPEQLGGLFTPRPPCKRRGQRVWETSENKADRKNITGPERTKEFQAGAKKTLQLAKRKGCKVAILAQWSPSCDAIGLTGRLIISNGIEVINTF